MKKPGGKALVEAATVAGNPRHNAPPPGAQRQYADAGMRARAVLWPDAPRR